jgi:GNAT superfamily N-acetyltransferase
MDRDVLTEVTEVTWPAKTRVVEGPWTFRFSPGGGKRVSAASTAQVVTVDDVEMAERRMRDAGQQPLFSVTADQKIDPILAENGYMMVDKTVFYHCDIDQLTAHDVPPVTAFPIWPPLQLTRDIWSAGGIGADRVAVMERARCDKTAILGRVNDRAGGAVYVGLHAGCVMIHALEVLRDQRRHGLARSLVFAAANWGAARGARQLALLVTAENKAANGLYRSLGMSVQDGYHYRVKR